MKKNKKLKLGKVSGGELSISGLTALGNVKAIDNSQKSSVYDPNIYESETHITEKTCFNIGTLGALANRNC